MKTQKNFLTIKNLLPGVVNPSAFVAGFLRGISQYSKMGFFDGLPEVIGVVILLKSKMLSR